MNKTTKEKLAQQRKKHWVLVRDLKPGQMLYSCSRFYSFTNFKRPENVSNLDILLVVKSNSKKYSLYDFSQRKTYFYDVDNDIMWLKYA